MHRNSKSLTVMKKSYLFLFAAFCAAITLSGCTDKVDDELEKQQQAYAAYNVDFTYNILQDGKVSFTNTSDDRLTASCFIWYFGTEAYIEKARDCTYTFKSSGTYTVTLQAILPSGQKKNKAHDVTVTVASTPEPEPQPQTTPTKIYITGVKYLKVDVQNHYYRAKLVDDDFFTTTWFNTDYTALTLYSSTIPYTDYFSSRVLMNGLADDEYYTLYIYHNTNVSGTGTQCLKQNIYTSKFKAALSDQSPYIEVSNNSGNTVVQLLMEYE